MKKIKTLFLTAEFLFLTIIISAVYLSGCSNSVTSSVTAPEKTAKTERQFALDNSLKGEPGSVIIVYLEDLNSPVASDDTGPIGTDIIPFSYTETAQHQIQIDTTGSLDFTVKFVSDATGEITYELNSAERKLVNIPAGNYKMHITSRIVYSGGDTSRNVVFIQPNKETPYVGTGGTLYSNDDLNTLITTRKCRNCYFAYGDLHGLDLSNVDASYSSFLSANLKGTILSNSFITFCNFDNSDLTGAVINVAHLGNSQALSANFTNASIYQSDLTNIYYRNCNFTNATLSESNLGNGDISYSNFTGTIATHMDLTLGGIHESSGTGANFNNAIINRASFHDNKFTSCSFLNAQILNSILYRTDISNSNITGASFCGSNKSELVSNGVIFNNTTQCWP